MVHASISIFAFDVSYSDTANDSKSKQRTVSKCHFWNSNHCEIITLSVFTLPKYIYGTYDIQMMAYLTSNVFQRSKINTNLREVLQRQWMETNSIRERVRKNVSAYVRECFWSAFKYRISSSPTKLFDFIKDLHTQCHSHFGCYLNLYSLHESVKGERKNWN